MASQIQASYESKYDKKQRVFPTPIHNNHIDIVNYSSKYQGRNKIERLLFLAERCPEIQKDAFLLTLQELRQGIDTNFYIEAVNIVKDFMGEEFTKLNTKWISNTNLAAQEQLSNFDLQLESAKHDMDHTKIRSIYMQIGKFLASRGEFNDALLRLLDAEEHCRTQTEMLELCLLTISLSVVNGCFDQVPLQTQRATKLQIFGENIETKSKFEACRGLFFLKNGNYRRAAEHFRLALSDNKSFNFPELLSIKDVATYCGVCSLASIPERKELKEKVLNDEGFKSALDYAPEIKNIMNAFFSSNYSICLDSFNKIIPDLKLDFYIHNHVRNLSKRIHDRVFIQYFSPFTSVNLNRMAEAFKMDLETLEKELVSLIVEDMISARIDSHKKILYAKHSNVRISTYRSTLRVGEQYLIDAKSILWRTALLRERLIAGENPKTNDGLN